MGKAPSHMKVSWKALSSFVVAPHCTESKICALAHAGIRDYSVLSEKIHNSFSTF